MTRRDRRLLGGFALGLLLLWLGIFLWVRLPAAPAPLPPESQQAILSALRGALEGHGFRPPDGPGLDRPARLPVFVSVLWGGHVISRRQATGATLRQALAAAAPPALVPLAPRCRIKVDLATARGPILWRSPFLFAFSVVPGIDGLFLRYGDREDWFLPDDLNSERLLTGLAPFAFMEFEFGLDVPHLVNLAALRMRASKESWAKTPKTWERFRTEAFVEPPPGQGAPAALPVVRGNTPGPPLDRKSAHTAAIQGGMYLLDKLRPDGSFEYEYDTQVDRASIADYALPRHFGAAMYLAQIYRLTGDVRFGAGAERAFGYIDAHAPEVLGSTGSVALAVLALTEYRMAAQSPRYDAMLARFQKYLLDMQRPAGDFAHLPGDRSVKLLYFDGEAAFALVRLAKVMGDPTAREAARRALGWLTHDAYDHFAGHFYFGEDHWTCMAAEAAWPLLDSPQYARFCDAYAAFLRKTQFQPGEGPPDFTGAYGFTPFFPPHSTPAASRTEAMVSAYLLGKHRGHPVEATRLQVLRSLRYLLAQQLRPENSYLVANPQRAQGGWMQSPLRRFVRIDFVQHAGDALLRGEELLDE